MLTSDSKIYRQWGRYRYSVRQMLIKSYRPLLIHTAIQNVGGTNNAANLMSALVGTGGLESWVNTPERLAMLQSPVDLLAFVYSSVLLPEKGIKAMKTVENEVQNTILNRVAELRERVSGLSFGDEPTLWERAKPDGVWLEAIHSAGKQSASDTGGNLYTSFKLKSSGVTVGTDYALSENFTLGAAFSYVTSNSKDDQAPNTGDTETASYIINIYSDYRFNKFFIDTAVSVGISSTSLELPGEKSDFDAGQVAINIHLGMSYLFNDNDSLVEPTIGFLYSRLDTNKYSGDSTGTSVGNVSGQAISNLELGAGVRAMTSFDTSTGTLLPSASFMIWHDFKKDSSDVKVNYPDSGGVFTYVGRKPEANRYTASIGVEYWSGNFSYSVDLEHNWEKNFKTNNVVGKVRYDF